MSYYQHPIKCMACDLHFIVCSNYEEWPNTGQIFCPECGTQNVVLVYAPHTVEGFIFQAVPGEVTGVRKVSFPDPILEDGQHREQE